MSGREESVSVVDPLRALRRPTEEEADGPALRRPAEEEEEGVKGPEGPALRRPVDAEEEEVDGPALISLLFRPTTRRPDFRVTIFYTEEFFLSLTANRLRVA